MSEPTKLEMWAATIADNIIAQKGDSKATQALRALFIQLTKEVANDTEMGRQVKHAISCLNDMTDSVWKDSDVSQKMQAKAVLQTLNMAL